jgi:phosphoglycolate phosphatase
MNLIIFDFDGTIADSLQIFIEATNRMAKKFGYAPVSASQIPLFQTLGLREMVNQLRIPGWKLPFFLQRFRRELHHLLPQLHLIPGMREALLDLHQQGYQLGIVTSNSRQNVEQFLCLQELEHLFNFIHGGQILSGKAGTLKKLVKQHRVQPQQLIFVGDEISDIKAAKQVGLANIAVSWGFNDRETLAKACPDVLIEQPEQLLTTIDSIYG